MTDWKWSDSESGWLAHASDEDASLVVAGSEERPEPQLCSAALSCIGNANALKEIIANALANTPVEVRNGDRVSIVVHPERPYVDIVQLEIRDSTRPNVAHVFVVTGYPDPYHLYDVTVDETSIVKVVGGFW